jgi:hypothetical protein
MKPCYNDKGYNKIKIVSVCIDQYITVNFYFCNFFSLFKEKQFADEESEEGKNKSSNSTGSHSDAILTTITQRLSDFVKNILLFYRF